MTTRRQSIAALALTAFAASPRAQQPPVRIYRIGALAVRARPTPEIPEVFYDALSRGLKDLGYVQGKNLLIDWRFAEGKFDRLQGLADDLVRTKPELIVTHSTPATEALKKATSIIPIVAGAVIDPVFSGFAASLGHPGGNITGLAMLALDLSPKYLKLLKTIAPRLSRVAVLANSNTSISSAMVKQIEAAANILNLTVLPQSASTVEEIDAAFIKAKRERADAIIVLNDGFFIWRRRQIVDLTVKYRLPSMFPYAEDTRAGGLMSYGHSLDNTYYRLAIHVDKILKGAKPADLPFEQPTTFHHAINLKTAKALGLKIPYELLLRANEVIE